MTDKETLRQQWKRLAPAGIKGTAEGDNVYREFLLDEWMLKAIGDVSGLRVLDLGCGEGRFARMLAKGGAKVTAVDSCEEFIEFARAHRVRDEVYVVGDIEDLREFANGSFDVVVSYVSLVDTLNFEKAVAEAYRVLAEDGLFLVCNLQPMCTAANGWSKDEGNRKLHFKLDNYFDEGPREMRMFGGSVTNFHRTLSTYVDCFVESGFTVQRILEPKPSPEQVARCPDIDDNLRVPYFMIFVLKKKAGGAPE